MRFRQVAADRFLDRVLRLYCKATNTEAIFWMESLDRETNFVRTAEWSQFFHESINALHEGDVL